MMELESYSQAPPIPFYKVMESSKMRQHPTEGQV